MSKTIYKTVYTNTIAKIKEGLLRTGDALPSTREMAKNYKCHRLTVMNVFQDLIAEGWIETSERSRYRVSAKIPITASEDPVKTKSGKDLSKKAKKVPPIDLEKNRYALEFWGGQPDLRLFPTDEFRRVLSQALKRTKPDQLNYGMTIGLHSCLKEVSDYLRKSRNLLNKEFIITNGSQEAILLIAQTFIKPGDKIAIERKGYPPAWKLFESLGAELISIEVDEEGLNTEDLDEKLMLHKIKLIYVTPLHQYPTTITMSPRRRQRLIELAEKHLIPILEDDYDHEFHYAGPPPPPLSTETQMGLYVCSFSKVLFPGARLGVIACDANILQNLSYQKFIISRQTDCLAQIGLSAWIRDGGFERHLRKMCRTYENRFRHMQEKLLSMQPETGIEWNTPTGGMSIWVNLNRDSKQIADLAKKKGVLFQHESSMDAQNAKGTHLRIGFAGVNEKEISQGLGVLQSLL